jgi:hypothetical protein
VLRTAPHPRAAAEAVALCEQDSPALVTTVVERQAIGVHAALTTAERLVPIGSAADAEALGWLHRHERCCHHGGERGESRSDGSGPGMIADR